MESSSPSAGPTLLQDSKGWPRERFVTAMADRDRTIDRQALVMELATRVVSATQTDEAVQLLVAATYQVCCCDRVTLFLVQEDELVCHAGPPGRGVGWKLPMGQGIAGKVAAEGKALNIPDVYEHPDLFDGRYDKQTGYRTTSILCIPLCDRNSRVVGVLEVINKKSCDSTSTSPAEKDCKALFIPFDCADERSLTLLLALTAQQLRVCEILSTREKAFNQVDSQLRHIEDLCVHRDIDKSVSALSKSIALAVNCQQVFIFLKEAGEKSELVCRAAWPLQQAVGVRKSQRDTVFGDVAYAGKQLMLNQLENSAEMAFLGNLMGTEDDAEVARRASSISISIAAESALCIPLRCSDDGAILGIVVGINKMVTLIDNTHDEMASPKARRPQDRSDFQPPSRRRRTRTNEEVNFAALEARALCNRLRSVASEPFEMAQFSLADVQRSAALLRVGAQIIKTSGLYSRQQRTSTKLTVLLTLLSDCNNAVEQRDVKSLVSLISAHARDIFECERCTFFMIDNYTSTLIGHYVVKSKDGVEEASELRLPMLGVVGAVATRGELLNIQDAWSNPLFSNTNDLKTGYRTKTILCAPLKASNGKVIAVMQCINKTRDEHFNAEDEEIISTISSLMSDLVQRMSLETSYNYFIKASETIDSDVKDLFREYYYEAANETVHMEDVDGSESLGMAAFGKQSSDGPINRKSSLLDVISWRSWDLSDYREIADDPVQCLSSMKMYLGYFGLLPKIKMAPFESFLRGMKARYNAQTAYHNWTHAFTTLHVTFLLLGHPAFRRLFEKEDILALLLAAIGHDVEHQGFNNQFLINTENKLALRYNDLAVLENHHAATTWSMIKGDESNSIFEDGTIQPETFRRIRKVVVSSILETDMAKHQEIVGMLEASHLNLTGLREQKTKLGKDDGLKLCGAILHCADLAHPTLPWLVHLQFSKNVATEFLAQFREEERLGMPTLPFMGKDPSMMRELAPIQVGFVQFVVAPLWKALSTCAAEDHFRFVVENMEANKAHWQALGDGEEPSDDQPFQMPNDPYTDRPMSPVHEDLSHDL